MIPLPLCSDEFNLSVGRQPHEAHGADAPRSANAPKQFWRTLDELADSPEFHELVAREFPSQIDRLVDPVSRRHFLSLMGASLALAGLSGCGRQRSNETIVPGVQKSEGPLTGLPQQFATAMPMPGGAFPMLVTCREGRPINVEGNHPVSGSASSAIMQASVLGLYDPDRAQSLKHLGHVVGWSDALAKWQPMMQGFAKAKGAGFALLTPAINSPTLAAQIRDLLKAMPQAKWYVHEPAFDRSQREADKLAFGDPVAIHSEISESTRIILVLDSDFLGNSPNHLVNARRFAQRRKLTDRSSSEKLGQLLRLYVVEPIPTPTGSMADERLPIRAEQIGSFAHALSARLGVTSGEIKLSARETEYLDKLIADLKANSGHAFVIAGQNQPTAVHVLVQAINEKLGALGNTVVGLPSVDALPESGEV